ncbi:hypothetical protein ACIBIZ_17660 [Nonomuraea spiralis]
MLTVDELGIIAPELVRLVALGARAQPYGQAAQGAGRSVLSSYG